MTLPQSGNQSHDMGPRVQTLVINLRWGLAIKVTSAGRVVLAASVAYSLHQPTKTADPTGRTPQTDACTGHQPNQKGKRARPTMVLLRVLRLVAQAVQQAFQHEIAPSDWILNIHRLF